MPNKFVTRINSLFTQTSQKSKRCVLKRSWKRLKIFRTSLGQLLDLCAVWEFLDTKIMGYYRVLFTIRISVSPIIRKQRCNGRLSCASHNAAVMQSLRFLLVCSSWTSANYCANVKICLNKDGYYCPFICLLIVGTAAEHYGSLGYGSIRFVFGRSAVIAETVDGITRRLLSGLLNICK